MNKFCSLTVLLLLLVQTVRSDDFNLDSLFTHSVGGPDAVARLARTKTGRLEGTVSMNGQTGSFVTYSAMPARYYTEARIAGLVFAQGYDGNIVWQRDQNNVYSELTGFERRSVLTEIYLTSMAYLFPGRMPGKAEYFGEHRIDSVDFHVVGIYPTPMDTATLFFDVGDGLPRYVVTSMDNVEIVTRLDDFRWVDGVLMPLHSIARAEPVQITVETWTEVVESDIEIDTTIFLMPEHPHKNFSFPDRESLIRVPARLANGHVWVSVAVNDSTHLSLILDSGASSTILDSAAVRGLGLASLGQLKVVGVGGYDDVELVRLAALDIGGLRLHDLVVGTMPMSELEGFAVDGVELDGILGADVLSRFPLIIDFDSARMTIFDPDGFEIPAGGYPIDFTLTRQIPTVKVTVNGFDGKFLVDLGNSQGVVLHHGFVTRHAMRDRLYEVTEFEGMLAGIGGGSNAFSAVADSFVLGDLALSDMPVLLPEVGSGVTGSTELAGIIGISFLQNYRLLLDYGRRRMVLYPKE